MAGQFTKKNVVSRRQVRTAAIKGRRGILVGKGGPARLDVNKIKGKLYGKSASYSSTASCSDW